MSRKLLSLSTFLCLALCSTAGFSASFDCKKATTLVEKAICANPKLSKLDEKMAKAYKQVLASSSDKANVQTVQKAWLAGVRDACQTEPCIQTAYQTRLTELATQSNSSKQTNAAFMGEYRRYYNNQPDEHTSVISIKPSKNNQVKVSGGGIWVGDTSTGNVNLGNLEGEFPVIKNTIHYQDDNGCQLTIVFKKAGLEVNNDNLQCGGLNVNFDGVYRKVN